MPGQAQWPRDDRVLAVLVDQHRGVEPLAISKLPPDGPPAQPATVTTIGQACYCVFGHYYAGPVLDDRVLPAGVRRVHPGTGPARPGPAGCHDARADRPPRP